MSAFYEYMDRLVDQLKKPVEDAETLRQLMAQPYDEPYFKAPKVEEPNDFNVGLRLATGAFAELTDPFQASRLAYVCGVFIERGAQANIVAYEIAQTLARALAHARPFTDAVDPEQEGVDDIFQYFDAYPDAVKAMAWMGDLSLAAMTSLCRAKNARIRAREIPGLIENIEAIEFPNDHYLQSLLGCVDDFEFVVIHTEQRRGFRCVAEAVRNNFHLFSLLQACLVGDPKEGLLEGPQNDPAMIAYMRGESHARPRDSDGAIWHFGNKRAWTLDGYQNNLMETSLWGEMSPLSIPMFEGEPTVLLGPMQLKSRTWDANLIASLHDAHLPNVSVRHLLTKDEVTRLLDGVAAENGA